MDIVKQLLFGPSHRFLLFAAADDDGTTGGGGGGSGDDGDKDTGNQDGDGGDKKAAGLMDLADKDDDGEGNDAGDKAEDGDKKTGDDTPASLKFDERPDWLPANFFDDKTGEVKLEALAKSQADLRAKISKGLDHAPKDPSGYEYEVPEALADVADQIFADGDPANDAVFSKFKEVAHAQGLSRAQFDEIANSMVGTIAELLPEPVDPQAEMKRLGKHGQDMVNAMARWGSHLQKLGVLNEAEFGEFSAAVGTADGMLMMQKIREFYGERPIPVETAQTNAGSLSADELRSKMAGVLEKASKGDPSAEREYERLQEDYAKLYGTDPATTSIVARP